MLPAPWDSLDALPSQFLRPLLASGFEKPTPIQAHAWPILLSGYDLIGIAQTGSGKTLAYLLPCFVKLTAPSEIPIAQAGTPSPGILVLAPTRELVCQIEKEAEQFRRTAGITSVAVYGGAPKAQQLAGLRGRPLLVVATSGRLNDFLESEQGSCSLHAVRCLVLDEADRMLDDGFEPQIRRIFRDAKLLGRQTLMFSATWPQSVQVLAAEFLKEPVEIRVSSGDGDALRANRDVAQEVIFCEDDREKTQTLVSLLRSKSRARSIVFVATKRACRDLSRSMRGLGLSRCEAIHGDRSQAEREAALEAFRTGDARVLFATDVAGRGLDVRGISLVVNFDPPFSAEDYVHRIGRTGRAGDRGTAVSLLTMRDGEAMIYIAQVMRRTGLPLPVELKRRLGPALAVLERAGEKEKQKASATTTTTATATSTTTTRALIKTTTTTEGLGVGSREGKGSGEGQATTGGERADAKSRAAFKSIRQNTSSS
ncbi:unnamed protein product [Polarella glacialis]|uniref:RNA helicase n=1 Tax=Polarella glacialis TaxID=89957 RepID=A0A813J6S6_POLGL|nr:unnamed protein product [Polarella glacialis]